MQIIKHGNDQDNLRRVLNDYKLSWAAKGVYVELISLSDQIQVNLIELSTHAKDGVRQFKLAVKQLINRHYLVIHNKLLIINSVSHNHHELAKTKAEQIMRAHDSIVTHQILQNQWQIVWHHENAQITQALVKLAQYLNPAMVLYGIQCSKRHCRSYRESLPYLNQLIMSWKRHHLTSIGQTQRWMSQKRLNSKPWNSETQDRIFSSRHRKIINNTPLRSGIPNVFKAHHHKKM